MTLGSIWNGDGTQFGLFSEHAERVELCLLDADSGERCVELAEGESACWQAFVPGVGPGQRYRYRVHGPWAPERGHRFDPTKPLIDPYAKAIDTELRCVVVDESFDWEGVARPATPWAETVVYELHVKGFTRRHPRLREELRGTYAGLASDEAIEYLTSLGVTAVELLPIHHFVDEQFIVERGLTNYWGYSSVGFFAPHAPYASTGATGEQVAEFKGMVKALHCAGIEVILDVVYNHTPEGDHLGPTLSFKGIDNASYYRLDPEDLSRYVDFTGTGNTLDAAHPAVLRLILDSLRYFAVACQVDGFRFDLAPALTRDSRLLDAIAADPALAQTKLIAEPWDLGPDGYRLGRFPAPWSEWNAAYRNGVRDFWRGRAGASELARRFGGSSDLFAGRGASASINFVTAHDGFTLADLVAYDEKHNEANREGNRDGTDDNRSWNCGVEGPSGDAAVRALRRRQQRNFLATLLLSDGVPMLLAGDELGRTQAGNNSAWCQDNAFSWLDWDLDEERPRLLDFARRLILIRRTWSVAGSRWLHPDGREMTEDDWRDDARALGVLGAERLLLFNGHEETIVFIAPPPAAGRRWVRELSSAILDFQPSEVLENRVAVGGREVIALCTK